MSPRVALRAVLVVAALVLLVVVVAGCGNAELPRAAPVAPAPPPTTSASPTPTTAAPPSTSPTTRPTTGSATPTTEGRAAGPPAATGSPGPRADGGTGGGSGPGTAGRGTPIWPVRDAASARSLQEQVDGGRQPWLLDPMEVATSYSGVALNYRNPTLFTISPGVIDVQDGATRNQATVTLAQTVRKGDGGIWVVTDVRPR